MRSAGQSFRRQTVTAQDVAPNIAAIFAVIIGILTAWQVAAPFQWEREITDFDIDGFPIQSTGSCESDDGWWFWLGLLMFHVGCLFYALILCFQTRHIQDDISESSGLFLSCIVFFQILVLAMPICAMVRCVTLSCGIMLESILKGKLNSLLLFFL